ncbi:hypothetical protein CHELA1G11_30123 [Hyphomicrobiales bacterium]|nr:hypothetical protein CHELA1G11_30123 [Hyphomicrobiales bacterium]
MTGGAESRVVSRQHRECGPEMLSADNMPGVPLGSRCVYFSLTLKRLRRLGNRVFLETENCRLTQTNRLEIA